MNAAVDLPFPWDVRPPSTEVPELLATASVRLCLGRRAMQDAARAAGHRGVERSVFALPMREWDALAARVFASRRKSR